MRIHICGFVWRFSQFPAIIIFVEDNISPSVLKAYRKSKIEQRKQMSETETEKDEEDEEPPRKKRKSQVKKTLGVKRRSAGTAVKKSAKKTELPSKRSVQKSKTYRLVIMPWSS